MQMSNAIMIIPEGDLLNFQCPHCEAFVSVKIQEINCAIFRHGTYKESYKQLDPHLCKDECDRLVRENLIYGCGRPFQLVRLPDSKYAVQVCEYI